MKKIRRGNNDISYSWKVNNHSSPEKSFQIAEGVEMRKILKLENLEACRIVRRLNRFVVEIKTKGGTYDLASINNTGRLQEFLVYGKTGYCLKRERPGKTGYRLVAIEDAGAGALIDTNLQMKSFEVVLEKGYIPWLKGYRIVKRNPRINKSMLDYLLVKDGKEIYLEIKSAVLRKGNMASYPDCPSERGRRHIRELIEIAGEKGAMILFISGLRGVKGFIPNDDADPEIGYLLNVASEKNVEIKSISMHIDLSLNSIVLENPNMRVYLSPHSCLSQSG